MAQKAGRLPALWDVSPFLQFLRKHLMGRDPMVNNRWLPQQAVRDVPPCNQPDGASSSLHSNYYYTRDARRRAAHPLELASNSGSSGTTLLPLATSTAKSDATSVAVPQRAPKTPGAPYIPPTLPRAW